jgi:hypothetical protein
VAQYTQWALCTPTLLVENVQAFWWGAVPLANTSPWFAMVDGALSETPLGTAYLGEVSALTTQGCPAVAPLPVATKHAAAPTFKRPKPHKRANRRKRRRPVKISYHHRWRYVPARRPAARGRR